MSKLDVSEGFTYSLSASAAPGSKVSAIAINGVAVDPAASYRVTVNSFLADGGDNYPVLVQGTDRLGGAVDLDALVAYFGANANRHPWSSGPGHTAPVGVNAVGARSRPGAQLLPERSRQDSNLRTRLRRGHGVA